jgi:hypothetical protein
MFLPEGDLYTSARTVSRSDCDLVAPSYPDETLQRVSANKSERPPVQEEAVLRFQHASSQMGTAL